MSKEEVKLCEAVAEAYTFPVTSMVIGADGRQIVISWNNTERNQNMVTILEHQDAVNVFAVLTSVLRKQKLLFP